MSDRRLPWLLVSLTAPALFSGCETTDKMLGAAERAVGSSSGRTVLDIVGGKDPADIARPRNSAEQLKALLSFGQTVNDDLLKAAKDNETTAAKP